MNLYLLFALALNVTCCDIAKDCTDCGIVSLNFRMLDKTRNEFVVPAYFKDRTMWYKDSFVIAENLAVDIEQGIDGKEKWRAYAKNYTLIDLRERSFYIFSSFSDTATMIHDYIQPDTGRAEGSWNFFDEKGVFTYSNRKVIADTTIEGILYKRVRAEGYETEAGVKIRHVQTAYLRCDKKGSFFYIDKPVSDQMGCPVLRFDFMTVGYDLVKLEVVFLSDTLTKEQVKVFDTWIKFIKRHPARIKPLRSDHG